MIAPPRYAAPHSSPRRGRAALFPRGEKPAAPRSRPLPCKCNYCRFERVREPRARRAVYLPACKNSLAISGPPAKTNRKRRLRAKAAPAALRAWDSHPKKLPLTIHDIPFSLVSTRNARSAFPLERVALEARRKRKRKAETCERGNAFADPSTRRSFDARDRPENRFDASLRASSERASEQE